MTTEHPFAVWTVFRHAPRWWLARECPPTVRHPRFWMQVLRVSILLGAIGFVAGWVSTFVLRLDALLSESGLGLVAGPGACFGLVVLIPLSRWCGRAWWSTLFAPVVAAGAYYTAVFVYLGNVPIWGSPHMPPAAAGFIAGACGAAVVAAWMTPWLWPRPPVLFFLVNIVLGGLGGTATGLTMQLDAPPSPGPPQLEELNRLVGISLMFTPYQTLLALGLGMRLWGRGEE